MNKIELQNVSFSYKKKMILTDFSIEVTAGECVGLMGESGKGKTTIGKLLAGYERPDKGRVLIDSAPLPQEGYSPVQLISQHPQLAFDERMKMRDALVEADMCPTSNKHILTSVGIKDEWLTRYPFELSGGELQRFSIARALNKKTKYIIADEMSAMLDSITQATLWKLLLQQKETNNIGILAITHNEPLAKKICDRIIYL